MKIRKRILKKLKIAYKRGVFGPGFPYTHRSRGWPDNKKPGYSHAVCGECRGYGYNPNSYMDHFMYDKCACELSGKGVGYTNKSYKNNKSLKRRFYFKNTGELPDFINIEETILHAPKDVVGFYYKRECPDKVFAEIDRRKNKKTFIVYIR